MDFHVSVGILWENSKPFSLSAVILLWGECFGSEVWWGRIEEWITGCGAFPPLIASLILSQDTTNLKAGFCLAMGIGIFYSERCSLVSTLL